MATIAIIYRDNELFVSYVPKLVDFLRGEGHEVQTKVFPQGTPEKSIAEDAPTADLVLPDETFCRATLYKNPKFKYRNPTLDKFFTYATNSALVSKGHGEGGEEVIKDLLKRLVTEALSNGAQAPEEIIVASSNLCDHKHPLKWASEKEAADVVAGWFREIFPAAEIRVTESAELPARPYIWLIGDRHHVTEGMVKSWRDEFGGIVGTVLRLPLETVARDLGVLGLISKDETVFENELRKHVLEALEEATGAG